MRRVIVVVARVVLLVRMTTLCLAAQGGGRADRAGCGGAPPLLWRPAAARRDAAISHSYLGHLSAGAFNRQRLDVMRVSQPAEGRLLHGFLSMEWAFAADLDLGLEHLRWLGSPVSYPLGVIMN